MKLERMQAKAELLRVQASRADMEINIFKKMTEIKNLEDNVSIQDKRINELEEKLKLMQKENNE